MTASKQVVISGADTSSPGAQVPDTRTSRRMPGLSHERKRKCFKNHLCLGVDVSSGRVLTVHDSPREKKGVIEVQAHTAKFCKSIVPWFDMFGGNHRTVQATCLPASDSPREIDRQTILREYSKYLSSLSDKTRIEMKSRLSTSTSGARGYLSTLRKNQISPLMIDSAEQ